MPPKRKGAVMAKRSQGQPGPSCERRGSDGRRTRKKPEREQSSQPVKKKRKAQSSGGIPSPERKVVVTAGQRAKWQPVPESIRARLQSIMRGVILAIVYENTQSQGQIEKHLNCIKERLVKHFETLKVPVKKQGVLKSVQKLQSEEEEKIAAIEAGLVELQDAIDTSVEEAKVLDEEITDLQKERKALKRELAAEEEMMHKLFLKESNDVLALPKLQKESLQAPLLQELILKIPNQKGVLTDLNKIQQSKEMKAMLVSLEQAYENMDEYVEVMLEGKACGLEQLPIFVKKGMFPFVTKGVEMFFERKLTS